MNQLKNKSPGNLKNLQKLLSQFDKKVKNLEKSRREIHPTKKRRVKRRDRWSVDIQPNEFLVSFGDSFSNTIKDLELEITQPMLRKRLKRSGMSWPRYMNRRSLRAQLENLIRPVRIHEAAN